MTPTGAAGDSVRKVRSLDELIGRARALAAVGSRRILGITGPPGAGKSTLAKAVAAKLDKATVLIPMDGYHLSNAELERLGRRDRKGAPDTFDAAGYVTLLRRLKAAEDEVVYAPEFRRELEEAIAGAIAVPRDVPLVITEGNYLLLGQPPWASIYDLMQECWYIDMEPAKRVDQLIHRHLNSGKTLAAAKEWVYRSDEANAKLVTTTRDRADILVALGDRYFCVADGVHPQRIE
jgi:pantothenate kinase